MPSMEVLAKERVVLMFEDRVALSDTHFNMNDIACRECDMETLTEIESEYHRYTKTTTWWAKFKCAHCGYDNDIEDWY